MLAMITEQDLRNTFKNALPVAKLKDTVAEAEEECAKIILSALCTYSGEVMFLLANNHKTSKEKLYLFLDELEKAEGIDGRPMLDEDVYSKIPSIVRMNSN
jgi:hypothetical protein